MNENQRPVGYQTKFQAEDKLSPDQEKVFKLGQRALRYLEKENYTAFLKKAEDLTQYVTRLYVAMPSDTLKTKYGVNYDGYPGDAPLNLNAISAFLSGPTLPPKMKEKFTTVMNEFKNYMVVENRTFGNSKLDPEYPKVYHALMVREWASAVDNNRKGYDKSKIDMFNFHAALDKVIVESGFEPFYRQAYLNRIYNLEPKHLEYLHIVSAFQEMLKQNTSNNKGMDGSWTEIEIFLNDPNISADEVMSVAGGLRFPLDTQDPKQAAINKEALEKIKETNSTKYDGIINRLQHEEFRKDARQSLIKQALKESPYQVLKQLEHRVSELNDRLNANGQINLGKKIYKTATAVEKAVALSSEARARWGVVYRELDARNYYSFYRKSEDYDNWLRENKLKNQEVWQGHEAEYAQKYDENKITVVKTLVNDRLYKSHDFDVRAYAPRESSLLSKPSVGVSEDFKIDVFLNTTLSRLREAPVKNRVWAQYVEERLLAYERLEKFVQESRKKGVTFYSHDFLTMRPNDVDALITITAFSTSIKQYSKNNNNPLSKLLPEAEKILESRGRALDDKVRLLTDLMPLSSDPNSEAFAKQVSVLEHLGKVNHAVELWTEGYKAIGNSDYHAFLEYAAEFSAYIEAEKINPADIKFKLIDPKDSSEHRNIGTKLPAISEVLDFMGIGKDMQSPFRKLERDFYWKVASFTERSGDASNEYDAIYQAMMVKRWSDRFGLKDVKRLAEIPIKNLAFNDEDERAKFRLNLAQEKLIEKKLVKTFDFYALKPGDEKFYVRYSTIMTKMPDYYSVLSQDRKLIVEAKNFLENNGRMKDRVKLAKGFIFPKNKEKFTRLIHNRKIIRKMGQRNQVLYEAEIGKIQNARYRKIIGDSIIANSKEQGQTLLRISRRVKEINDALNKPEGIITKEGEVFKSEGILPVQLAQAEYKNYVTSYKHSLSLKADRFSKSIEVLKSPDGLGNDVKLLDEITKILKKAYQSNPLGEFPDVETMKAFCTKIKLALHGKGLNKQTFNDICKTFETQAKIFNQFPGLCPKDLNLSKPSPLPAYRDKALPKSPATQKESLQSRPQGPRP